MLYKLESEKLLTNAPTFRHGWEDGAIKLEFADAAIRDTGCGATMRLELPQSDLDQVNAYLDRNPAKRILLGAQGYAIPENHRIAIDYLYVMQGDQVLPKNEGNKPLADLHHSIEFMYQLLAQIRADIQPDTVNGQPWPEAVRSRERQRCMQTLKAEEATESACDCRVEKLAAKLSPRQLELVDFLLEQPYSTATGALIGYTEQSKAINYGCKLAKR